MMEVQTTPTRKFEHVPWWVYPLMPIYVPIALVVLVGMLLLSPLSIVWFEIFPDYHVHAWDYFGSPRQKARLERWRAAYQRLGMCGRIRRAWRIRHRPLRPPRFSPYVPKALRAAPDELD
jgi:hypothetical protein